VALLQLRPIASELMRSKSKLGSSMVSTTSRTRCLSPAATLGSVRTTCSTSPDTRLTSTSGASWAIAGNATAARTSIAAWRQKFEILIV
jgi:hypothetical protein